MGPILGVSTEVPIDLQSYKLDELIHIYKSRPNKRPVGGFKDELENTAEHNQELLKVNGDWIVFPRTVNDFAKNNFAIDNENNLLYKENNMWKSIKTIVYSKNKKNMFDKHC